jgi:hypothetical protein
MIALALLFATLPQHHRHVFPDGEPVSPARGCDRSGDEITICGDRDQSTFRARALPARYQEKPLRPEVALPGGGWGRVEAVQRGVGGVSVPAAMVTLRIPLGKKPANRGAEPDAK